MIETFCEKIKNLKNVLMRKKILLKENEKNLCISIKVMLKSIISKKNINTFLSMCLIISYMIKKFDFAPK